MSSNKNQKSFRPCYLAAHSYYMESKLLTLGISTYDFKAHLLFDSINTCKKKFMEIGPTEFSAIFYDANEIFNFIDNRKEIQATFEEESGENSTRDKKLKLQHKKLNLGNNIFLNISKSSISDCDKVKIRIYLEDKNKNLRFFFALHEFLILLKLKDVIFFTLSHLLSNEKIYSELYKKYVLLAVSQNSLNISPSAFQNLTFETTKFLLEIPICSHWRLQRDISFSQIETAADSFENLQI